MSMQTTVFTYYNSVVVDVTSSLTWQSKQVSVVVVMKKIKFEFRAVIKFLCKESRAVK